MEHTEIVEKYVNGEIDEAAFNAEYEKLDDAAKKVVTDGLKEAKPKILSEISGLRQERDRVKTQKVEAEKPPEDFMKRFRTEQVTKALSSFFKENGIEEAEQATIKANFEKLDDGAIDADLIKENLKRVHAYTFPDKILKAHERAGEEGAAEFNGRQASSAAKTGSPTIIKEDDPRIARILAAARAEGIDMTPEEAKRGLEAGVKGGRRLQPLPAKQ